jgi:hypothetical protein
MNHAGNRQVASIGDFGKSKNHAGNRQAASIRVATAKPASLFHHKCDIRNKDYT